jgi:hypothetical protein
MLACSFDDEVLLACADGVARTIGGEDDDGEVVQSHVLLGPVRLGGGNEFGILQTAHGTFDQDSDSVYWRLVVGDTAQEAAENAKTAVGLFQADDPSYSDLVFCSGEWTAGRSRTAYPRARAMWAVLWLESLGQWAYEGISLEILSAGRWR